MNFLIQKITDSCLDKIDIPLLYTKITNIYRDYYRKKNVNPIIYAIRLFEESYNPNIILNPVNNRKYDSMKKLLERSE